MTGGHLRPTTRRAGSTTSATSPAGTTSRTERSSVRSNGGLDSELISVTCPQDDAHPASMRLAPESGFHGGSGFIYRIRPGRAAGQLHRSVVPLPCDDIDGLGAHVGFGIRGRPEGGEYGPPRLSATIPTPTRQNGRSGGRESDLPDRSLAYWVERYSRGKFASFVGPTAIPGYGA